MLYGAFVHKIFNAFTAFYKETSLTAIIRIAYGKVSVKAND